VVAATSAVVFAIELLALGQIDFDAVARALGEFHMQFADADQHPLT
jgi:hypothetical protein